MRITNSLFALLLSVSLLSTFSCSKSDHTGKIKPEPAVRNQGLAVGNPSSFSIGETAGSYTVPNTPITVDVPAGAANPGTILSVQEITNTSPGSFGPAFRITTDIELNAPVTVNYSYRELIDSVGQHPECRLGISWQDTTGIWWMQAARDINLARRSVSISMISGDLALAMPIKLTPAYSTVTPGAEVNITAAGTITVIPRADICSFFRSGASPIAMTEEYILEPGLVDRWVLMAEGEGIGTLHPTGASTVYKTTNHDLPIINPVTILLFTRNSPKPHSANVFVQTEVSGLNISIGNLQYVFNDDMVDIGAQNDGIMGIRFEGPDGFGSINWKENTRGEFQWNESTNMFMFNPSDASPLQVFQSMYNDGLNVSAGSVTITQSGAIGQKISGTIYIEQAGRTNTESGNGEYLGASRVVGSFNLMRDY